MQIFLETARLVLRQFTEDDVENLVELDSDPDVMHFINGGRPTPRREIVDDVLPAFLDHYERFAGLGFWAAMEKSSGRFVGWFHFRPATDARPDEVELGYRLRKSFWGKGYATEASRLVLERAAASFSGEILAMIDPANTASQNVARKLGFSFWKQATVDGFLDDLYRLAIPGRHSP